MPDIPPRQQVNGSETIRMGQTDGLPHYDSPDAAHSAYREIPQQAALARRQPDAEDGAYAILKAFQDYMEHERQRSQRRTTALFAVLAVVFLALVAGFGAIWFTTMNGMQGTQANLIQAALAMREREPRQPAQIDIAAAIEAAAGKAAENERAAAARILDERLAAERRKDDEDAVAREAALDGTIRQLNSMIEEVRKDNDAIRKENEAIRRDNDALRRETEALRASRVKPVAPRAAHAPLPAIPAAPAPAAPDPAPEQAAPAPAPGTTAPADAPGAAAQNAAAAKPAQQPATPKPQQGHAIVATETPALKIKRPAPPRGYSSNSLQIPVGEKGDGQVPWRLFLPTEIPSEPAAK